MGRTKARWGGGWVVERGGGWKVERGGEAMGEGWKRWVRGGRDELL